MGIVAFLMISNHKSTKKDSNCNIIKNELITGIIVIKSVEYLKKLLTGKGNLL